MPRGWVRLVYAALISAGLLLAALPFHGHDTSDHPGCGSLLSPRHEPGLPDKRCVDSDYDRRQAWATALFVPGVLLGLGLEGAWWLTSPGQPRLLVIARRRATSGR